MTDNPNDNPTENPVDYLVECPDCEGYGYVNRSCSRHSSSNCDCEVRPSTMTCDRCNGEGRVEEGDA
jgi:DnaJ-class molecular chaperone